MRYIGMSNYMTFIYISHLKVSFYIRKNLTFFYNRVLDLHHIAEVQEQALCIIGNNASIAGAYDYVMDDDRIFNKLLEFMVSILI